MAIKKSELYSSLWASCDELRGGMDASQYKDYVLVLLFMKYVSDNPPFSTKAWSNGFDPANDLYHRFAFGIPPQKNGDYAFLLHILASLKSNGKGAVILPHGVLFRGGAEAASPRRLLKHCPKICWPSLKKPGCSTPTTCISTSWTTGPRRCRTTFT